MSRIYEDMALGNLSQERYQKMAEGYEAEQASLNNEIIVYTPEKQGTKRVQKVRIIFNFLDEMDMPEIGEPVVTETTYGRRKTA